MSLFDCVKFLFGDRGAIERVAACRSTIWVGLVFVLMASLAREYDQEDLVHEPWLLLLSPLASLAVASLLFAFVRGIGGGDQQTMPIAAAWRRFVGLFWMTGPLAWVYAIPYEQFLEAQDAVAANLWSLGLVATWRVVLIIRVIAVLHGVDFTRAGGPVMLIADVIALVLIQFLPFPIIVVMGGAQDPELETVRGVACSVLGIGVLSLPVWLWTTVSARIAARKAGGWCDGPPIDGARNVRASVWVFAAALLAAAAPAVGTAQRDQTALTKVREQRVEQVLQALDALARHSPDGAHDPEDVRQQQLRDRAVLAIEQLDRDAVARMSRSEAERIMRGVLWHSQLGERVKVTLDLFRDLRNQRYRLDENMRDEWARTFYGS